MSSREEFIKTIKKINKPRVHSILNSYGIKDGYKYYKQIKPELETYSLTEQQYSSIIKAFNERIKQAMSEGVSFILPCRLGTLELRKKPIKITINEGKIKSNHAVDWDRTLKFWYEDEEAYKNKTLIRLEGEEIFKVLYNKSIADYKNKAFYGFKVNRDLKVRLKKNINNNKTDAFLEY